MTYDQAKEKADNLHKEYLKAVEYAQSIHDHKWEQRVNWAQYCPGCDATQLVKGPVDEGWGRDDEEDPDPLF